MEMVWRSPSVICYLLRRAKGDAPEIAAEINEGIDLFRPIGAKVREVVVDEIAEAVEQLMNRPIKLPGNRPTGYLPREDAVLLVAGVLEHERAFKGRVK